jgi:hypothetical protein
VMDPHAQCTGDRTHRLTRPSHFQTLPTGMN